ncbi:MAG: hypothetical protein HQL94_01795 [Magnetococcales bacterium]|nr:hypothetical protein [Magnetococcales bacterium]MBF0437863.1 hypothetical protein [Magnetococcales bacterium]
MDQVNQFTHSRLPNRLRAALCVGAILASGSLAHAENLIVFKAVGVSLTVGQSLDGSQPLHLKAGEKVEMIAANGRMIKLSGPYDQAPAPEGSNKGESLATSLKAMVASNAEDSSGMGITRSATSVLQSGGKGWIPEPWLINVTLSGNHCQRVGQPVVFWRPESERESQVRLSVDGDSWIAKTNWPAGAEKLAPPASMPFHDGGVYQITLDNAVKSDLTMTLIPAQVTAIPVMAAWMQESGCHAQSMALLRTLK